MAANETGTVQAPVGQAIAVHAEVSNESGAQLTKAAAFEVAIPLNTGTIATLYGLRVPNLTQGASN